MRACGTDVGELRNHVQQATEGRGEKMHMISSAYSAPGTDDFQAGKIPKRTGVCTRTPDVLPKTARKTPAPSCSA
eukprot:3818757-Amphidinium_carterae.2